MRPTRRSSPPTRHRRLTLLHYQVVHGLSIPLGKLGWHLPRTLSRGHTDETDSGAGSRSRTPLGPRLPTFTAPRRDPGDAGPGRSSPRPTWRVGGTVIRGRREGHQLGRLPAREGGDSGGDSPPSGSASRTIRFPDEAYDGGPGKPGGDVGAAVDSSRGIS